MRCPVCNSFMRFINLRIGLRECTQPGCTCIVQHMSEEALLKKEVSRIEDLNTYVEHD